VCVLVEGRGCVLPKVFFTYDPPEVQSIEPNNGSTAGENTVVLNGKGFGSSAADITVFIGSTPCTNVQIVSEYVSISCQVSAGTGKNLNVNVTVNGYAATKSPVYSYHAPTISYVCPTKVEKGDSIRIYGKDFAPTFPCNGSCIFSAKVKVGEAECANVQLVSLDQLTCTIPIGVGKNAVVVSVGGQTSQAVENSIAYFDTSTSLVSAVTVVVTSWVVWLILAGVILLIFALAFFIGRASRGGSVPLYTHLPEVLSEQPYDSINHHKEDGEPQNTDIQEDENKGAEESSS